MTDRTVNFGPVSIPFVYDGECVMCRSVGDEGCDAVGAVLVMLLGGHTLKRTHVDLCDTHRPQVDRAVVGYRKEMRR